MGGSTIWASSFLASPAHHQPSSAGLGQSEGAQPSLGHGSGLSPAGHYANSSNTGASHSPGSNAGWGGAPPHPARSAGEGREGHQFRDPLSLCGTWSAGIACLLSPHCLRQEREDKVVEGRGQELLGIQVGTPGNTQMPLREGGLAKVRAGPLCCACYLGPLPHPLPIEV